MKSCRLLHYWLLIFALAASGMALAQGLDYTVNIHGIEDSDLLNDLRENSLLISLQDQMPVGMSALRRRAGNDTGNLIRILRENSYFNAAVDYVIDEKADGEIEVSLNILPGKKYVLSDFVVAWQQEEPKIPALAQLSYPTGELVTPDLILAAEQEIINLLMQNGYPFPAVVSRRLLVEHATSTVQALITFDQGELKNFGQTKLEGNTRVKTGFLQRRIAWQEGDLFDIRKVARTRQNLLLSGVIASADIRYPEDGGDGETLPVNIDLRESKHRSIGGGATYSTSRGIISQAFWEHRNLMGGAERLRTRIQIGTRTYAATADLNKPDMWGDQDFSWQASAEISREELEAFDRDLAALSSYLSYQYTDEIMLRGGALLEQSRIRQDNGNDDTFTLLGAPLLGAFDNTGNLLDPRDGFRINLGIIPYKTLNEKGGFFEAGAGIVHYTPAGNRFVWANKARASALFGQSRSDIPADKRLYAGGGGSVRGYGHQMIGPLDEDGNPTGGRMLVELGTELRFMVTGNIELAGFYEGARVTRDLDAASDEDFRWGTGIGARYHTAIGPIRLDLAIPLDKREVDDNYQFYISIGQAF